MARWLFPGLAVVDMIALAIAFGQNDLANCAAPGLAAYTLIMQHFDGQGVCTPSEWLYQHHGASG